jgi:hypothetical protein
MPRARLGLRSRKLYYGALLAILGIGAGLTVAALPLDGAGRDILINLGASVVGVFLVAVVLEPIVERGLRREEQIHGEFPHRRFIEGVAGCARRVRILGAWPYVMEQPWRQDFLDAVEDAVHREVVVEILILDPTSPAATQRLADLGPGALPHVVSEMLTALDAFRAGLPAAQQPYFRVRVYNALPPARLYRWDHRAISSFFPGGNRWGAEVRHYETPVTSGLGAFVDEQFTLLWNDPRTQDLVAYLRLPVDIPEAGGTVHVRYVECEDVVYAIDPRLTGFGPDVPADDEAWPVILEFYSIKYGSPGDGSLPGTVRWTPYES